MQCERCHQREATVVLTTIVEDEKSVVHLCSVCADAQGIAEELAAAQKENAAMAHHTPDAARPSQDDEELRCPSCGLSYTQFKERYRLGCAECYSTFREKLRPLLRKVHGADTHRGKHPTGTAAKPSVETTALTVELLKRRMQAAIEREEFEEAARLRDQIEELQKRTKESDGT